MAMYAVCNIGSYSYITIFILQKNLTNEQCIVFSSDQYKRLYWYLFGENYKSVLTILRRDTLWTSVTNYPVEWTELFKGTPQLYECNCPLTI